MFPSDSASFLYVVLNWHSTVLEFCWLGLPASFKLEVIQIEEPVFIVVRGVTTIQQSVSSALELSSLTLEIFVPVDT